MDAAHDDIWGGTGPAYLVGLGGVVPVHLFRSDAVEAPGVVYVVGQSGPSEGFAGGGEDRLVGRQDLVHHLPCFGDGVDNLNGKSVAAEGLRGTVELVAGRWGGEGLVHWQRIMLGHLLPFSDGLGSGVVTADW